MATTTNFNWSTPDDTSLVKDGAAAIRTLGSSIDTTMAELKGGTTGQVLSKTSNTDMDFTWVAQDDSNAIQNAIVDAKGDLITATANDTPARIGVGADGTVLKANSATATGLEWGSAAAPLVWSLVSTTSMSGSTTVNLTGLNYKNLRLFVDNATSATSNVTFTVRPNNTSTSNYVQVQQAITSPSAYSSNNIYGTYQLSSGISLGSTGSTTASAISGFVDISSCDQTTGFKPYQTQGFPAFASGATDRTMYQSSGIYTATVAITSIAVLTSGGTFSGGTLRLYGAN